MKTQTIIAEELPLGARSSWTTWFSRLVMAPLIVVLAGITIRYFTHPEHAVPGITLGSPEAFTDMRTTGVWTFTLWLMLVTSLAARERLWLGHLQIVAFTGVALVVRIYGFQHDGTTLAVGNERFLVIVETLFLLLNGVGLMLQLAQRRHSSRS